MDDLRLEEVTDIVINLPFDGDKSELSDFEGSEGDVCDATLNDQDEMDEFSNESEEEARNNMKDNPPVRHGNGFWGRIEEISKRLFVTIPNLPAVMDQRSSLLLMLNPLTSLIFCPWSNSGNNPICKGAWS